MTRLLLDTGPLVAFYCERDHWFSWVREKMRLIEQPLFTCESVLSEAAFLIRRQSGDPEALLRLVQEGHLKIALSIEQEAGELQMLMRRYRDVSMSLADACLVRMSEIYSDCRLLTLDKDFTIYRRHGRQIIPLMTPWD